MAKTIRSEVLAFVLAAQDLLNREAREPGALSDHETEKIADCMAELEQVLLESRSSDGKVTESEGDSYDGDGIL